MYTNTEARSRVANRGPRYAVYGQIRQGEAITTYADTAERAERVREQYEETGYYTIKVHPPEGSINLAGLGATRNAAKVAFDEATSILKAGVLRALEEGRAEAEIARTAGVDRMTVRTWAGK